jgi:predicted nucleotidyltransferase
VAVRAQPRSENPILILCGFALEPYNALVSRDETVAVVRRFFESAHRGVAAAYLFGSAARDALTPESDVDVGVLFDTPPGHTFDDQPFDLEGDLERALGRRADLVVLNRAPVDLRARVLRTGQLVFERDAAARIHFEVQTRNEAFDLEAILRRYREPDRSLR